MMGSSASSSLESETAQYEVYKELKNSYDKDINPKLKSGEIKDEDAFRILKSKYDAAVVKQIEEIATAPSSARSVESSDEIFHVQDIGYPRLQLDKRDPGTLVAGDIVKAKVGYIYYEGVVVDPVDDATVSVDFGDVVERVNRKDCYLVLLCADIEVGDKVEIKVQNQLNMQLGEVASFNADGTVNINVLNDHREVTLVSNVQLSHVRKFLSVRNLSLKASTGYIKNPPVPSSNSTIVKLSSFES